MDYGINRFQIAQRFIKSIAFFFQHFELMARREAGNGESNAEFKRHVEARGQFNATQVMDRYWTRTDELEDSNESKGTDRQKQEVIDRIRARRETGKHADECVMRSSFLWLVAEAGTAAQVQRTILNMQRWLAAHPHDAFIRVANLLFFVKRRGTPEQRQAAIEETRQWLERHGDDSLVALAHGLLRRWIVEG